MKVNKKPLMDLWRRLKLHCSKWNSCLGSSEITKNGVFVCRAAPRSLVLILLVATWFLAVPEVP